MNQIAPYADVHQPPHMAAHHSQLSGPPSGLGHYAYHQQPLQPQAYQPQQQQQPYGSYSYASQQGHPVTSMGSTLIPQPQPLPLPAMTTGVATSLTASQFSSGHTFDTTGQIAPPGMKPRVTATLWEDEGSLCFQVEAKGVCVARREDNHMINGTKLLNVAGMTRGRRDGILKSEKTRHVVKIGPMHLKGVWIPFDRALDFANKEKITEQLYPLFVHDIGALLYHPSNQPRPGMANSSALAAVDRRRSDARYLAGPQTTQAPSLHHHHSMSQPMTAQPQHSIAPHPSAWRPGLDRAHTFPTPPTSASSNFGVNSHGSSDYWNGQQAQPGLSINTELSNARSVPTTPASTPPGLQPYQTSQAYEASRQVYTAPPSQGQYPSQYSRQQFGGPLPSSGLPKTEMAPPPRAGEADPQDTKAQPPHGEEEAEHEQEPEYTHTSAQYNGGRQGSYSYNPNAGVARVSDDVTASPHQNGAGRATPRTAGAPETQWQPGYAAQPGPQAPASNVYQVMEPRAGNGEQYAAYPSGYVNGSLPSAKRVRELDDDEVEEGLKRQKTLHEEGGPVGGGSSPFNPTNRPRAQPVSRKGTR